MGERRARAATWWVWALLALNGMWATDLFVLGGGFGQLGASGALLSALGRLTGLYGALALLLQLVLIARIPVLESALGLDRLTGWHRWTGFWTVWLVLAHVVLITLGYTAQDRTSLDQEIGVLLFDTPDVLKAVVAVGLLAVVAVTSMRLARRHTEYESWHFVHVYAYLVVVLGFLHQVSVGRDFVGSPAGRAYWWTLFAAVLSAVLLFRVLLPVGRASRHRLRVVGVVRESADVVSVYIGGRALERLGARAGQFFLWRFLTRDLWWQAHPYSLSAMPDGRVLRITVKALGAGSGALGRIKLGTRVLAEGPYGAFTSSVCSRPGVLLIAGGVGITPIRALFEEFTRTPVDVVLLYRVTTPADAVLYQELRRLAHRARARVHVLPGPVGTGELLGPRHVHSLVPDAAHRDVYVCGPPGMTDAALESLRLLGVPRDRCHTERFTFAS